MRQRQIIRSVVLLALTVLGAFPIKMVAQVNSGLGIIMSATTAMPGIQSNSSIIVVTNKTNCLDVKSGLPVITASRGTGIFALNCEPNKQPFNTLGIRLYPNPVSQITRVKFINTPPLEEEFSISISAVTGNRVDLGKRSGYSLYKGCEVDLSGVTAGTYIMQITSKNYTEAIKVIKVY